MEDLNFLMALGSGIRKARKEKNMSQSELAALCNFEKSNMSRIEAGNANPTILTLRKICKALQVKLSVLLIFIDM